MNILVIASHPGSLVNFRGPLLKALVEKGHAVHVAAPDLLFDSALVEKLTQNNIVLHEIRLNRTGLNPITDLLSALSLWRLMRAIRPDAVLSYTIKPVIWGSLAASAAGVRHRFALITGLGYAFTGKATGKRKLVQKLVRALYRKALTQCELVQFQNSDDLQVFMDLKLLSSASRTFIVNGSGVDVDHFCVAPIPEFPLQFLLIARLLGDKGIREYATAAAEIRKDHPDVSFHLVGGKDTNPDSIPAKEIESWVQSGSIIWHGQLSDVRPSLAACHVFVLPSYREGTPRTVLEAMATGRAIITTDAPGCKETTIDGQNGFLVPIKDAQLLAEAMRKFISNRSLVAEMGAKSREIVVEKYEVSKVNSSMLKAMNL